MGFQRLEDQQRVERAKEFFKLTPNQSPTALVIGVHPDASQNRPIRLKFLDPEEANTRRCELTVVLDGESDLAAAVARLKGQLDTRLAQDQVHDEQDEAEEADEGNGDEDDGLDDELEDEKGIELAHSLMGKFRRQLDDSGWVEANQEIVLDLAKPATIIDGQHRVRGAALCERNIPFAVIALYDCAWAEQVFQFTVVNYSAEGIPDQFITANAALSLTESELGQLQTRLVQAQVKVIEYELMRVVQFNSASPFYNLVNLSEGRDYSKIGYKTMVRVARDWYQARPAVIGKVLLPRLFPDCRGKGAGRERLRRWRDDAVWGDVFVDFWRTVHDYYQPHQGPNGSSLWKVGESNLTIAIVLLEFQRQFFQDLTNQDEEFFDVPDGEEPTEFLRAKLRNRAQKFVTYFPPEFFGSTWGTKSLNISSGRRALVTALERMLKSKGKYQYERSSLFTGEVG